MVTPASAYVSASHYKSLSSGEIEQANNVQVKGHTLVLDNVVWCVFHYSVSGKIC